jgi:predicted 3-demethylubiquinone-9 3-methyltransferase (glyoxalase superfamily)
MQKITPFLWFDGKAEEAMTFYTSIFKDSKVIGVTRYGDAGPAPKGTVMSATFELNGQEFIALNGGPQFTFTPAVSFFVSCETQEEVDEPWEKLVEGGEPHRCGCSRTNMACLGRSFRRHWAGCCRTRNPRNRTGS